MRHRLAFLAAVVLWGACVPSARAAALSMRYTIDPTPAGGLYTYGFRLTLDNADGTWVPGQGWGWVVFGDVPAGSTSPIADFQLTHIFAGNPFNGLLGFTGGGITGGGHNGPTLTPFSFAFPLGARIWTPAFVGQSIEWSGTAGAPVLAGLKFSTIEQVGNATKADFDPAVYVGVPEPAAVGPALAAVAGGLLVRRRSRHPRAARQS
jgi:hypothetical protein